MSDFGIQVSSYSVFGRKFSKFYPCEPTDDFLVHETLGLWNVYTFLALLKCAPDKNHQSSRVLPLFRHSCLRLNCIAHMYQQLMILFKTDCHSNASFWIKTFVICACVNVFLSLSICGGGHLRREQNACVFLGGWWKKTFGSVVHILRRKQPGRFVGFNARLAVVPCRIQESPFSADSTPTWNIKPLDLTHFAFWGWREFCSWTIPPKVCRYLEANSKQFFNSGQLCRTPCRTLIKTGSSQQPTIFCLIEFMFKRFYFSNFEVSKGYSNSKESNQRL